MKTKDMGDLENNKVVISANHATSRINIGIRKSNTQTHTTPNKKKKKTQL
jgi:hypothetical protein